MTRALLFFFPVGLKEDDSKGGLFALCTLDGTQHFILGGGMNPVKLRGIFGNALEQMYSVCFSESGHG